MPMSDYIKHRHWSDQYLPWVYAKLGKHFGLPVVEATPEEDMKRNTDAMVGDKRVAIRVRRPKKIEWLQEFTIRYDTYNSQKTELQKIQEGWGDYMFYGWVVNDCIQYYTLFDLGVFRRCFDRQLLAGTKIETHPNNDGNPSILAVFRWASYPVNMIIMSNIVKNHKTQEQWDHDMQAKIDYRNIMAGLAKQQAVQQKGGAV